jgi:acyl-coenzyme A thioesterase PaaI-like protein
VPEGESYTTVEMKIYFLRPAWKGRLEGRGDKAAGR